MTTGVSQRGLSLLELLVAFSIMALALGMLYRSMGGSVRSASMIEVNYQVSSLAQSLLSKDFIPPNGWHERGESAGYLWEINSTPYGATPNNVAAPMLHEVVLVIRWVDRSGPRQLEWSTLRPVRKPLEGEAL